MTDRRLFLKAAGGLVVFVMPVRARASPGRAALRAARELIRAGALGSVGYCRVGNRYLLPAVRFVLDRAQPDCVVEVDSAAEGAALLGSQATLVMGRDGFRLFGRDG
ncbi:MAG: hypothetical protein LAP40_12615 [Acidobacteriia bacterium]|nr:hypothetical protein [Terriglobia bacterium]